MYPEYCWVAHSEFPLQCPSIVITVFPVSKTQNKLEQWTQKIPEWHIQNVLEILPMVHHFW